MSTDRYAQYMAQLWRRLCWVGQAVTILMFLLRTFESIRSHPMFDPVAQAPTDDIQCAQLTSPSGRCQRRLRFRHFPAVPTRTLSSNEPWLAAYPRLAGRRLRHLYPWSRMRSLGRYIANPCRTRRDLAARDASHPKSTAAKGV